MADTYGGRSRAAPACAWRRSVPGRSTWMLGIANAAARLPSRSSPITAQAGLGRIYKESHQFVDIVALYRPITKWQATWSTTAGGGAGDDPQGVQAGHDRTAGCDVHRAVPETSSGLPARGAPLPVNVPRDPSFVPRIRCIGRPTLLRGRRAHPAGAGGSRDRPRRRGRPALIRFSETPAGVPVATTFLGKGVFPDDQPNALGTIGFMVRDYDELRVRPGRRRGGRWVRPTWSTPPERWRDPNRGQADRAHPPARSPRSMRTTRSRSDCRARSARRSTPSPGRRTCMPSPARCPPSAGLVHEELERGAADDSFPLKPQRFGGGYPFGPWTTRTSSCATPAR